MDYNKAPIEHSPFDWQRTVHQDMKVKDWIVPQWQSEKKDWNVVLLGTPLSRSSISVSGASEFPNAFRQSWEKFSTYYIDEDIDIRELTVADIGNVKMHVTDILRCHQHIEDAMVNRLHVSGGGSKNPYLMQMTADALGIPVICGPTEGTALGNVLMQIKAQNGVGSLEEMRAIVANSVELKTYNPK